MSGAGFATTRSHIIQHLALLDQIPPKKSNGVSALRFAIIRLSASLTAPMMRSFLPISILKVFMSL